MITSVVGKNESWNVDFPVQSGLINKSSQLFGNGFVANFCLAVALGVVAGSGGVPNVEQGKKMFGHFVCKFFPLVSN